jgi:hypothetical protein
MAVANTQAYYNTATITAIKIIIVQAPGIFYVKDFCLDDHLQLLKSRFDNLNLVSCLFRDFNKPGGNHRIAS